MSGPITPKEIIFNQTERITTRLRDLVRSYPKGLALIKEFLQNADDAEAKDLRVIYDRRCHDHDGAFPNHPKMKVALGPALLFFNDQPFTDDDFQRIQEIGEGGKGFDAARTGRFGQGFNTCYSVSDHPSLLTGNQIAWFDPHHFIFSGGKNACAWELPSVVEIWPEWIETFRSAVPAYRAGSSEEHPFCPARDWEKPVYYWDPKVGFFPGTVFRLPVRSTKQAPRSEILPEAFTDKDFEAILDEIRRVGPALLIFLRSVTSLEIREIDVNGKDTLRYWIHTNNANQVNQERKKLRGAVQGQPQELLEHWLESAVDLPVIQFDHQFVVCDGEDIKREETWAVTTGLFGGPDNVLLKAALDVCQHGDKAIPWAGAAVHCSPTDTTEGPIDVKYACFLPLPLKEENKGEVQHASKSWTVWLHGWFDLNSSRREITSQADVGEKSKARYQWNLALMQHAVGPVWAKLVQQTLGTASDNTTPYILWPLLLDNSSMLEQALKKGFFQTAAMLPVIRGQGAQGYHWCCFGEGVQNLASKWHEHLLAPLLAEGQTICSPPLPEWVRAGFNSSNYAVPTVTPSALRVYLHSDLNSTDIACEVEDAPCPMLRRREWIYALAEFCAEDDWDKLNCLPLALLADHRLHTFTVCGKLYWVEEDERILLELLPTRMLDSKFQKRLTLKKLENNLSNVVKLNLQGLIECITEILANTQSIDRKKWLSAVFKYLKKCSPAEIKNNSDQLKKLKIIPDQFNRWHCMGLVKTPLLPIPGQTKELHQVLTKLNILLLQGTKELTDAIHEFKDEHSGFVWNLTPNAVAAYIKLHVEDSTTLNETALDDHQKNLYPLLDFLASKDWLKKDDQQRPQLRKARILPTVCGDRVAAETQGIYMLGGFEPPPEVKGKYRVLYTKSNDGNWKKLFESLGVPILEDYLFTEEVLLPSFIGATPAQQLIYLTWLRDQFKQIFQNISVTNRERLQQKIMDSAVIPIKDGKLAAPKKVYHPDAKEPVELLGNIAHTPDIEFKKIRGSIEPAWLDFFDEFQLPKRPLAEDILTTIKALVEESKKKGVSAVRERLRKFMAHLNERWSELGRNQRLVDTLKALAWLPAISKQESTRYAACADWGDQLWRAGELVPPRLAHLVASAYRILDGLEFNPDMSTALGLRTRVELNEVLGHFEKVRKLPIQDNNSNAISQAATAAYRFLGQSQATSGIKELSTIPSVYIKNYWQRPDRCFFNSPVETRWTISLKEAKLGTESIEEQKGLEKMGVQDSPHHEHWLKLLQELSRENGDKNLPEKPDKEEARIALRFLRSCPDEWLKAQHDIPVLLENGKLKNFSLAFIRDDPRLERLGCLAELPLIEAGDATDIGRRVNANSLKDSLKDRMKEIPQLTNDPSLLNFSEQIQQRVRSEPFSQSLRRIAYHTDSRNALSPSNIIQVQSMDLRITTSIRVESFVNIKGEKIEGQEVIAFERDDMPSFLDKNTLWLLSKGKDSDQEDIQEEIVRTICKICGLNQEMRLNRLLEKEPNEMLKFLDERDIARLPDTEQLNEILPPTDTDTRSSHRPPDTDTDTRSSHRPPDTDTDTRSSHRPPDTRIDETLPKPKQPKNERIHTYVYVERDSNSEEQETKSGQNIKLEEAARKLVCDYEEGEGRKPTQMNQTNPGYDIMSCDPKDNDKKRYIEVKSISGAWNMTGVGLSNRQFKENIDQKEKYWLYVVENALSENYKIYRIQNPIYNVDYFMFDMNWKMVALHQEDQAGLDEQTKEANLPDWLIPDVMLEYGPFGVGRLIRVEHRGGSITLWVNFSGHERPVPFNDDWIKKVDQDYGKPDP